MKIDRIIELLKIEHECMLRGAHNICDRNCSECELVQDDAELHEMYTSAIAILNKKRRKYYDMDDEKLFWILTIFGAIAISVVVLLIILG